MQKISSLGQKLWPTGRGQLGCYHAFDAREARLKCLARTSVVYARYDSCTIPLDANSFKQQLR